MARLVAAFIGSLLVTMLIVRYAHTHARLTHDFDVFFEAVAGGRAKLALPFGQRPAPSAPPRSKCRGTQRRLDVRAREILTFEPRPPAPTCPPRSSRQALVIPFERIDGMEPVGHLIELRKQGRQT